MVRETRVQRKKRKLALYRRIAATILVLGLIICWSLRTKLLEIEEVKVEGNVNLSVEEIIEASKIQKGANLIITKSSKTEDLLKDLSFVESVDVKKKLPGTVIIDIKEREPYVQFHYNYSFAVVDTQGVLLEYATDIKKDIPLITGFQWQQIKSGETIMQNSLGNELQDIFNDKETEKIVLKFREIGYDEDNNVKIKLNNGIVVEFGPLYNVKYKIKAINEIVEDLEKKNIPTKMIILNKGDHPIVVRDEK